MTATEAIKERHSVRKYTDRPIETEKTDVLRSEMERANAESGLNIQLVLEEPKCFSSGVWKYGQFSGVKNYFVMAGPKGGEAEEKIGYFGEKLVILAQTLGLNTCWVGLTYKKIPGTYTLRKGDVVYGVPPGVQHPMKPSGDYFEPSGSKPEWFMSGMSAAMLAPTAINQQKFKFILQDDGKVQAKTLFSMAGYTRIDLGIVKYHFEVGAGKERFEWA